MASGPTLTPSSGSYSVGQAVTATYSCTDDRSGIVRCGASTFSANGAPLNTGTLNSAVDTSSPGPKTYTVTAVDAAGNQSSASVNYVVTSFDTAIKITLSSSTVTYPLGTNVVITVAPTHGHTPTGSVQLFDGTTLLQTSKLQGNGAAYLYIQGLPAGAHPLSVVYSGDAFNPGGSFCSCNAHSKSGAGKSHRLLLECQLPVWRGLPLRSVRKFHCRGAERASLPINMMEGRPSLCHFKTGLHSS